MTNQNAPGSKPSNIFSVLSSQPYLLLVLAPLFWGGNVTAGKLAVGQIDPYLLLVSRWIGATALVLTIAIPHVKRDWPRIRPNLGLLIFYGAVGFGAFNLLIYTASHHTAAVNSSIEQAAIPVMVLIGNFVIFRVQAKPLQIVGLVLTMLGVLWVATHGEPTRLLALDVNIGDAMVLLACLFYAAYSLTLKYRPTIHWLSFILVTAASALIASLLFVPIFSDGFYNLLLDVPNTTLTGWLCVIYVMSFPSILAQLCYAKGVEMIGPNRASIFINLLPVFGTILSVIIVGESFQSFHLTASVLVIVGIVLAEYSVRRGKA